MCMLQLHSCNVNCVNIALEGHNKILIPALYFYGFICYTEYTILGHLQSRP